MKTVQIVLALLAVVALVFGTAYLLQNVQVPTQPPSSGGGEPVAAGGPNLRLAFPELVAEWGSPLAAEFEVHTEVHRDFWFSNPHDIPFKLGVDSQSCKCSRVEVALLSPGAADQTKAWQQAREAAKPQGGQVDEKAIEAILGKPNWVQLHREESGTRNQSLTVEPKAGGLVRLWWKVQRTGPERVSATLWVQPQAGGPATREYAKLEVAFVGVSPVAFDPQQAQIADLAPRETRQVVFTCFSPTRPKFTLTAQVLGRDKKPDPCFGTQIRPLTAEECQQTSQRLKTRVLCGYRLQVDIHERVSDSQQIDLGPFRRRVECTTDVEPELSGPVVSGTVRGDVTVGSAADRDRVALGSFESSRGAHKEVLLTTEPGVELVPQGLEVEPEFLKVQLTRDDGAGKGSSGTWRLRVEVPKNATAGGINGQVGILVRTPGNPPRRIRVPVVGTAYN